MDVREPGDVVSDIHRIALVERDITVLYSTYGYSCALCMKDVGALGPYITD